MQERAEQFGTTVDRDKWRLVGPMHLAETREQARRDVEYGLSEFASYFEHILPFGPVGPAGTTAEILDYIDGNGFAIVGTPDDAIAKIESLVEQSGGFGAFLNMAHEWANPAATTHSYELMAQYVLPHFQGQLERPKASYDWVVGEGTKFVDAASGAIGKAMADHEAERAARGTS
jgi:limonene 1,2-monooxygenase